MIRYINRAIKLAKRSPIFPYGTGAVIVLNNKIVGEGVSHVSDLRLSELHSLHAELHALVRTRHLQLDRASVYVATWKHDTERIVLSKPCLVCSIALRSSGIRTAIYTDGEGGYGELDTESDVALADCKRYRKPCQD